MSSFQVGDLVKHKDNKILYGIIVFYNGKLDVAMIGGNYYDCYELMEEFWKKINA